MVFLSTLFMAVLITIGMTPMLCSMAIRHNVVDIPGDRKVHTRPIPRIGGVAMACGAFAPLLLWYHADRFVVALLAGAAVLIFFGLLDDLQDLPPKAKFAGQFIAALVVIFGGGVRISSLGMLLPDLQLPTSLAVPLTLLAIVGATNAINLADGLDGLAGGMCLLIFSAIGSLAYLEGSPIIGLIALAMAGVLFGFLRFNTHPASVFMGDAGSQFLGFTAATLSIELTQATPTLSPVLPLILLGFPILDTLTVMVTRIAQGRSPFSADKNHFHHHLLGLGLRQAESVLVIYVLQTVLILSAILLRYHSDWILLVSYFTFSGAILLCFSRARRVDWHPRRFRFFDAQIADRLQRYKQQGTVIRRTFPVFEFGIPLLLLATCALASNSPGYVTYASLFFALAIGVTWLWARRFLVGALRFTLYLLIPFAVYLYETGVESPDSALHSTLTLLFGLFAVLILLISKFSRRQSGFKSSPMDFLIIILAVAVPNLHARQIHDYQLGLVAAKVIMLYFSFEVLLSELRGRYTMIAAGTVASLLLLALH